MDEELLRYDVVIHLRTPSRRNGYHRDAVRIENVRTAELIDEQLLDAWEKHPRRIIVDSTHDFLEKARRTIAILDEEISHRPVSNVNDGVLMESSRPAK